MYPKFLLLVEVKILITLNTSREICKEKQQSLLVLSLQIILLLEGQTMISLF